MDGMDGALADVLDAARSLMAAEQDLSQGTDAQHVKAADSFFWHGVSYITIQTPLATLCSRGNILHGDMMLTSEHLPGSLPDLHDIMQHADETLVYTMHRQDMHPVAPMQTNDWPTQTEHGADRHMAIVAMMDV
jgi:hypothetical protein